MRKLKGFCDIENPALTKERWGTTKFPQGQPRIYICNDFAANAEPAPKKNTSFITHKQFLEMLKPAWMKGSTMSDVEAILKRTCLLLITKEYIYFRPAPKKEVLVERLSLPNSASLLRDSEYLQNRKGNGSFRLTLPWMANGRSNGCAIS